MIKDLEAVQTLLCKKMKTWKKKNLMIHPISSENNPSENNSLPKETIKLGKSGIEVNPGPSSRPGERRSEHKDDVCGRDKRGHIQETF